MTDSATDNRTTELLRELRDLACDIHAAEIIDHVHITHRGWTFDSQWLDSWHAEFDRITDKLEQAIAATLGSDQELIDLAHNAWSMALCAMQGMPIPAEWGDRVERGLRKHGINVDEELAGFEVIDDER